MRSIRAIAVADRTRSRCPSVRRSSGSRSAIPKTSTSRSRRGRWPSWPIIWSPRGWSRTSPTKGCGSCCTTRASAFQAVRTWKRSNDPDFEAKRDRIVELYALAEAGQAVVICLDEFGPLNLQPQPGGKGWAPRAKPKRIRATYKRPHGVRHLIAAYDVGSDRLYGHIKKRKGRVEFLAFCRYIRSLYPPQIRLHFVLDNFSAHKGETVRQWAAEHNVELAYTPFYASWLTRIEAQFRALRYFTLAGTDHPDHATQARLIRRYIAWRNRNTDNPRLRALINTANVA